jgi:hypothetical protein
MKDNSVALKNPILITGSPRSGTTWVGKIIAKSPKVHYVHEPFNFEKPTCSCGVKFDSWFFYISKANEAIYLNHIKHILNSPFNYFNVLNYIKETLVTKRLRYLKNIPTSFSTIPLLKDPLAVISSEWLASTFGMKVIVLIRHPAAIASSYKRLNWSHPFSHFLNQPLLMTEHLYPFESQILDFANNERDIIDQAALLWKLIYHMVIQFQKSHNNWIFIRHEDLSRDPETGFQRIFNHLNLEFSDKIKQTVTKHSFSNYPIDSDNHFSIVRNSQKAIGQWKINLTLNEIERIRESVEQVSSAFYSEKDW